jgi:hypothetical protein
MKFTPLFLKSFLITIAIICPQADVISSKGDHSSFS